MPTFTTNYNLTKIDAATMNWHGTMNANLDSIDAIIGGSENVTTYSATPVFDLSKGGVQVMTLTGSVTSSTVSNPSGKIYTFVIIQDSTGGRSFVFPASFRGAGTISVASGTAAANSIAIQTFAYIPSISAYVAVTPLIYGV